MGIVAPPPKAKPAVKEETIVKEGEEEIIDDEISEVSTDDLSGNNMNDEVSETDLVSTEESSGPAFASYSEEDFKPPSYEEMEKEMVELRAKRAGFPEAIGRRVHEINFAR